MPALLQRLTQVAGGVRGRVVAADPDRARIRLASRATLALLLGLGAMAALALPRGQPVTVLMLAGVIGMLSAVSVNDPSTRGRLGTAALVPVVATASVALAVAFAGRTLAADAAFVVVMAAAAYARRFGPRGLALGMVAFMAFFFTLFLQARASQLPWLALAAGVGAAAMALVRFVLLPDRPASDLRRMLRAFRGRAAEVAAAVADVLDDPTSRRAARRLRRVAADLNRVTLRVEQQLEDDAVAVLVDDPERLRGELFDAELTVEHLAEAVQADGDRLAPADRARIARAADRMAVAALVRHRSVRQAVGPAVDDRGRAEPARHLVAVLGRLGEQLDALAAHRVHAEPVRDPSQEDGDEAEDDAPDPAPEEADSRRRLSPAERAAVQVSLAGALAIAAGHLVSPLRWYWAVIAAFVVFANAPTRAATVQRAFLRVVGTAAGVVGGVAVGALLSGQAPLELGLVVVLVFVAFYLFPVSQTATMFCFTVMLALLYSLMGMLTDGVLLLRLEETAVGAVIGGLVAVLVVPRRAAHAIDEDVVTLLEKVDALVGSVDDRRDPAQVRQDARAVDEAFQALRDSIRPAVAGVPGALPRARRHLMTLLAGLRYWARVLAVAAASGDRAGVGHVELEVLRGNLDAIRQHVRSGNAAPVRPVAAADERAALLVGVGHAGIAVRRLDETVTALARATGVAVDDRHAAGARTPTVPGHDGGTVRG